MSDILLRSKWLPRGIIVALVVTTAIHLSTFCGLPIDIPLPLLVLLFVPMMAALGLAMIARKLSLSGENESSEPLLGYAPGWLIALCVLAGVYAVFNFLSCLGEMREGLAVQQFHGSYEVIKHGQSVRTLTTDEYFHKQTILLRCFSGLAPHFYLASLATLISARRRDQRRLTAKADIGRSACGASQPP